jgi:asparagine synthase (glutamine-hydrolysing)
MCGIVGWVEFGCDLEASWPVVDAMVETLRRRGPDSAGIWVHGCAALGHRRLAVIDPLGGQQPMTAETPEGPVTITYSGEAYNFEELRDQLRRRGHQFKTLSDTEVVLRGYLEWGEALAPRLNGMFAFAIWDSRHQVLVMVRDRLGVKPLYYYPIEAGILFASEPKAIFANPRAERIIDVDGLRSALAYTVNIPGVPWAGMYEVGPGDIMTVDRSGLSTRAYWRLTTREHIDDQPSTVARIRELLDDIVRRQLVADVPLGVLLSGGIDSSTITALAAACRAWDRDRIDTYDVDFVNYEQHFVADRERAARDAPYVAEVVAHVGTHHRTITLDHAAIADPELWMTVVRAYDLPPVTGDRDRSLHLLFRAIREASTVALSGESADELFGGYAWLHDPTVQRAQTFPWVAGCFDRYGPVPGSLTPSLESTLDLPGYIADQYACAVSEVEHLDGASEHERRMRVANHLCLTRSVRVLLDRKDRVSMATGLEVRIPYCDHRLVEYVYNTPGR